MKQIFTLVLLSLLFSINGHSQTEKKQVDVIYLIDGSILKGELIEYKKGEQARIILKNGTELTIRDNTIDRIVQERPVNTNKRNPLEKGKLYHTLGFSANFGDNLFSERDWGLGIEHVTAYWLTDNLSLGLGAGLIQYSSDYNWRVAPVFMDFKLKSDFRSPFYLGGDVGIGFPLKNENRNLRAKEIGERFRIGIGKIITTRSLARLSLEVSYLHQRASFESDTWGWWSQEIIERNIVFKRYQLKFGVLF